MTLPNLESIPDGLVAIFTTLENSQLHQSQNNHQTSLATELEQKGIQVLFIHAQTQEELADEVCEILKQCQPIFKKNQIGDNLLIYKKEGGDFKLLVSRAKPESRYNWVQIISQFHDNYNDTNPDDESLWRWGQIVPESGEYLCRDCGYIDNFEAGQVFPICEVCLAGDPEGPMEISAGFWEKI